MDPSQRIRALYDRFSNGDYEDVVALMHDDVRWHVESPSPLAGTHEGREAVRSLIGDRFGPALKGTQAEVQDLVVEDDGRVSVRVRFLAGGSQDVTLNAVHIFQVDDDGIREMWFHPLTDESVQRFWAEVTGDDTPA